MEHINPHHPFNIPGNLIKLLKMGDIRIWDVRTPMEFYHGHIEGAENVPFDELEWYLSNMKCDDKIIVTCSTGDQRSTRAFEILRGKGLEAVDGGDWEQLREMTVEEES